MQRTCSSGENIYSKICDNNKNKKENDLWAHCLKRDRQTDRQTPTSGFHSLTLDLKEHKTIRLVIMMMMIVITAITLK